MKATLGRLGKKLGSLLLLLILLNLAYLAVLPVSACGCGLLVTGTNNGWTYGDDSAEQSFINWDKGTENLIISLDIKSRDHDAVLIVPVPAAANLVRADVLAQTPRFEGYNVKTTAKNNLRDIKNVLLGTQIYPIPFVWPKQTVINQEAVGGRFMLGAIAGMGDTSRVTVYQHLEKEGMVAEVLTAEDSRALYDYLTEKGLKVEKDAIPVFQEYIHKDFAFTVAWINPQKTYASARGLLINFPTIEMYYPLKPNSAYPAYGGDKNITIVGYVSPKVYKEIKSETKVEYYYSDTNLNFDNFYSGDKGFGFTKITIGAEPKQFVQDLYISKTTPIGVSIDQFINIYPWMAGLIWLVGVSYLTAYMVKRTFIREKAELIWLGVFNCLSLLGTITGAFLCLKQQRVKYVFLSTITFVLTVLSSWLLLMVTLTT